MKNVNEILLAHDPKFHTGEAQKSEANESESTPKPADGQAEELAIPAEPSEIATIETTPTHENSINAEQIVNVASFSLLFIVPFCFWLFRHRQ